MLELETKFATIHSIPDPKHILSDIRERFAFPDTTKCVYYSKGSSDLYKVYTPKRNYFARLTGANNRGEEQIRSEIDFIKFLNHNGLNVSYPICDTEGVSISRVHYPEGDRFHTLFSDSPSQSTSKPSPDQLRSIGQYIANVHQIADKFSVNKSLPQYDLETCLNKSIHKISSFLRERPEIRHHGIFFQNLALQLKKKLSSLPLDSFSWEMVHGDFIFSNFHLESEDSIELFDFERTGYGWRACEIATYIGHLISKRRVSDPVKLFTQVSKFLIEGYESVATLSDEEKSSLPLFYQMQRIWMRGECCDRYIDWSSSFMTPSSWAYSIRKHKAWARILSRIEDV